MMKRSVAAIAVIAAFVVAPVNAQSTRGGDADMKEIESYKLTLPVLQKMVAASKALVGLAQQDPKFRVYFAAQKELAALQKKEDPTAAEQKRIDVLQQQIDAFEQSQDTKDGDAQTLSNIESAIKSGDYVDDEFRIIRPDGEVCPTYPAP